MNGADRTDNQLENQQENKKFAPIVEAKLLLRAVRWATLATLAPDSGAPFASLVNVASAADGSPILLLSQLAAHRRHIAADPEFLFCSICPKRAIRWRIRASLWSAGRSQWKRRTNAPICAPASSRGIRNPRFMPIFRISLSSASLWIACISTAALAAPRQD